MILPLPDYLLIKECTFGKNEVRSSKQTSNRLYLSSVLVKCEKTNTGAGSLAVLQFLNPNH
jgi:hypothetical protein